MGHFPWLCSITRGYYTYIDVHSPLCHHFRFQSQQRLLFPIAERVSESNSAPLQSVHCSMPGIREFVLPPAAPWRRFRAKLKKKRSPGCDEPKSSPYNSIYYNILHACVYIYTHTTHTYIYIYIHMCVYELMSVLKTQTWHGYGSKPMATQTGGITIHKSSNFDVNYSVLGFPQFIQNQTTLVLKPTVTWGSPMSRTPQYPVI